MNADLQQWIARLSGENLPGFATTAKQLAALTGDSSSAQKVTRIVQPDAAMTVRILRLANSAYHNPTQRKIDSLGYACVVLGVKAVRNLALTAASLQAFKEMDFGMQFQRELAFTYHGAMQSQNLAHLRGLQQEENVYVAALLSRLGHWIFWCFPYGYGERLASHSAGLEDASAVEKELLGFTLDELTHALLIEWHLDPLLALLPLAQSDKTVALSEEAVCVREAFLLVQQLRRGWQHNGYGMAAKRLVVLCRLPRSDVQTAVLACVREVRKTLKQVGIDAFYWPPLEDQPPEYGRDESTPLLQQALVRDVQVQKQNRQLRQLTHMLCSKVDVARCLRAVVEGVCKGIAFENAFAIVLHPKKLQWRRACHEGQQGEELAHGVIALLNSEQDCLASELKAGRICWPPINPRIEGGYSCLFGGDQYIVFPLRLGGKNVGYIGAVKAPEAQITEEDFEVYCHFCDHALVAIKLYLFEHDHSA